MTFVGLIGVRTDPYWITDKIPFRDGTIGEVLYDRTGTFFWSGTGTIWLSQFADGTGAVDADDVLYIDVTHADGSTASFSHDFGSSGSAIVPAGPFDLTAYFEAGANTVRARVVNTRAPSIRSSAMWLVPL